MGPGPHGLPHQQLPEHDPHGVDVGAQIDLAPPCLLRRHVGEAAVDLPGLGHLLLEHRLGQAEVCDLDLTEAGDQHVGGADVAVDQLEIAVVVGVVQPAADLHADVEAHLVGYAGPGLIAAHHQVAQVLPLHILHGEVDLVVDEAGVEDLHQVALGQLDHDLGLVQEAPHQRLVVARGPHALDHTQLLEAADLAGQRQEELPHPAPGQGLEQDVLAERVRELVRLHQRENIKTASPRRGIGWV